MNESYSKIDNVEEVKTTLDKIPANYAVTVNEGDCFVCVNSRSVSVFGDEDCGGVLARTVQDLIYALFGADNVSPFDCWGEEAYIAVNEEEQVVNISTEDNIE